MCVIEFVYDTSVVDVIVVVVCVIEFVYDTSVVDAALGEGSVLSNGGTLLTASRNHPCH